MAGGALTAAVEEEWQKAEGAIRFPASDTPARMGATLPFRPHGSTFCGCGRGEAMPRASKDGRRNADVRGGRGCEVPASEGSTSAPMAKLMALGSTDDGGGSIKGVETEFSGRIMGDGSDGSVVASPVARWS